MFNYVESLIFQENEGRVEGWREGRGKNKDKNTTIVMEAE